MNLQQRNRRLGCLYGQAIGDALGVRDEFRHSSYIAAENRDRLTYGPSARTDDPEWLAGEWSDDTEQALCLLRCYVADGEIRPATFAGQLLEWLYRDGRGVGGHTLMVLNDPRFPTDPLAVSRDAWEKSGHRAAANGAVMRASAVGVMRPGDIAWTIKQAVASARTTHWDPKCVASTVAVAVACAELCEGKSIEDAILGATLVASGWDPGCIPYMQGDLAFLNLDEGLIGLQGGGGMKAPIGYTYKTLGAGFWALRCYARTADFRASLDPILAAGGDVDTNAAVAGALLGAHIGFVDLPRDLVFGLPHQYVLGALMDQVFTRAPADPATEP